MIRKILIIILFIANVGAAAAQGTLADYQRSKKFREALADIYYIPTNIKWNKGGNAFLYECSNFHSWSCETKAKCRLLKICG